MSIDIRPSFPLTWHEPSAIAGGATFLAALFLGAWLLLRSSKNKMAGFGLVYALTLFFVEFTTVRLQEPFALYRSYLWAPGFLLFGAALLRRMPKTFIVGLSITTLPYLAFQAVNRLESLVDNTTVWEDAADKLGSDRLPGAFRIYYNRGAQYTKSHRYNLAMADMNRCEELRPDFFACHLGKALIFERRHEFSAALSEIEIALVLDKNNPATWEKKGRLLDTLCLPGAQEAYAEADRLGGSLSSLFRNKKSECTTSRGKASLEMQTKDFY